MASPELTADQLDRIQQLRDQLPFEFTHRPMFGGFFGYADGKPFLSISHAGTAVKLSSGDQEVLLRIAGTERLQYDDGSALSRSYVVLPRSILDDDDALTAWLVTAATFVARQPGRKRRRAT